MCVCVSGTYIPKKEVAVLETIKATVIRENQAIRLRARKEGVDRGGVRRVTGTPLHILTDMNSQLRYLTYSTYFRYSTYLRYLTI